jgi:hypothetical protein
LRGIFSDSKRHVLRSLDFPKTLVNKYLQRIPGIYVIRTTRAIGRGILLARSFIDEVNYCGNRNAVPLVQYKSRAARLAAFPRNFRPATGFWKPIIVEGQLFNCPFCLCPSGTLPASASDCSPSVLPPKNGPWVTGACCRGLFKNAKHLPNFGNPRYRFGAHFGIRMGLVARLNGGWEFMLQ